MTPPHVFTQSNQQTPVSRTTTCAAQRCPPAAELMHALVQPRERRQPPAARPPSTPHLNPQASVPKIPKASAQHAGHKKATKHPGPRIGIKHSGPSITKPDSKVARTTDPKAAKPTDPKASKVAAKVAKSGPKATKSDAKASKSDSKAAKSGPKATKSNSKATKPSDFKAAKPTYPKPVEAKPKDAGAKAASPKPSK
ncbi:histone H1.4-like [Trichosurus vulpecula]|uniref:histone H1.4-like n=1 Tax=Trichosurus vulpecula TaxID=9337 RepID=UPI00186B2B32|nr:histone H1.4-like [Trichosurus vulpecula]